MSQNKYFFTRMGLDSMTGIEDGTNEGPDKFSFEDDKTTIKQLDILLEPDSNVDQLDCIDIFGTDGNNVLRNVRAAAAGPSTFNESLHYDLQFVANPANGNDDVNKFYTKLLKDENNQTYFVKHKVQNGRAIKTYQCGICGKQFAHLYVLMRHLPTHTDERNFKCSTCGKAFRQMSTLSQHKAIHSTDRPYVCGLCSKTFNRASTLISHRKTHNGIKPHKCHICNKAFHQKGNLRNHVYTHTNERPYKCDVCGKGFNQMSNLMCHKKKAHQQDEKPLYACSVCGEEFHKRFGLRNHEQYKHKHVVDVEPGNQRMSVATEPVQTYENSIVVDPIETPAMREALSKNQIPFALLKPARGVPVLVRVFPAGEKQMLLPATAEDIQRYGIITINAENETSPCGINDIGKTVSIRIPVVATVVQSNNNQISIERTNEDEEDDEEDDDAKESSAIGDEDEAEATSDVEGKIVDEEMEDYKNVDAVNAVESEEKLFVDGRGCVKYEYQTMGNAADDAGCYDDDIKVLDLSNAIGKSKDCELNGYGVPSLSSSADNNENNVLTVHQIAGSYEDAASDENENKFLLTTPTLSFAFN